MLKHVPPAVTTTISHYQKEYMPKTIKEVYSDYAGVTTIEYSDDTTRTYSVDEVATVKSNPLTGENTLRGADLATYIGMEKYLQTPALAKGLRAVKAGTADLVIAIRGDSTFAGYNGRNGSFALRFADSLRNLGYVVSTDCLCGSNWAGSTDDAAYVQNYYGGKLTFEDTSKWMNPVATGNIGFGGRTIFNATASDTSAFTWQPDLPYDQIVFGAIGTSTSGVLSISKGGNILNAGYDTSNATGTEKILSLTNLADKSNGAITIRKVSGGMIQPNLIFCKSSTEKRVYIVNAARGSAKVADYIGTTYLFDQRQVINNQIQPNVTINHLGINDFMAGTTPTSIQTDVTTLIDDDLSYGRDSLWVTPAPIGTGLVSAATQRGIVNAVRAATRDTGVPLIDLNAAFKTQAASSALYRGDNIHWVTAGDVFVESAVRGGIPL